MRKTATTALGFFVLVSGVLAPSGCSRPDTVRTVFAVEGMHCESCSSAITVALEKTEGVVEASADHELGTAEAIYHSRQVTAETLATEIEDLGYTVTGETTETFEG